MPKVTKKKKYVYEGFGFPVILMNVPMIKVRGSLTPKVDYNHLTRLILLGLTLKPARLTGSEVRFVRLHFEMTLKDFGDRFVVSHPAVLKWENKENKPTDMAWSTEKDMRLFITRELQPKKPKLLTEVYDHLQEELPVSDKPVTLDLSRKQAA